MKILPPSTKPVTPCPSSAVSRVVQITEDYALAHTAERLYVTDLCEAAGVSERTLQYAFKFPRGEAGIQAAYFAIGVGPRSHASQKKFDWCSVATPPEAPSCTMRLLDGSGTPSMGD
jgi:hypothetical protein